MNFNYYFCWYHLLSIATTSSVNYSVVLLNMSVCKTKLMEKCLIMAPGFSCLSFGSAIFIFHSAFVGGGKEGGISCPWSDSRGGLCFICSLKIIIMSQQKCVLLNVERNSTTAERQNMKQMYHMLLCTCFL